MCGSAARLYAGKYDSPHIMRLTCITAANQSRVAFGSRSWSLVKKAPDRSDAQFADRKI